MPARSPDVILPGSTWRVRSAVSRSWLRQEQPFDVALGQRREGVVGGREQRERTFASERLHETRHLHGGDQRGEAAGVCRRVDEVGVLSPGRNGDERQPAPDQSRADHRLDSCTGGAPAPFTFNLSRAAVMSTSLCRRDGHML
jgi:hypothetical protein